MPFFELGCAGRFIHAGDAAFAFDMADGFGPRGGDLDEDVAAVEDVVSFVGDEAGDPED